MTTALAERPKCSVCGCYMELRAGFDGHGNGSTAEQRWCGIWYDHPPAPNLFGHTSSVLLTSPELAAVHGAAR